VTKIKTQPQPSINVDKNDVLKEFQDRLNFTLDEGRPAPIAKHHARGYRSARENLDDLCDANSFLEYGQLAVAAQRKRRDFDDLKINTAADGILTGLATINADMFGETASKTVVIVNDYTVLAGTQGVFHHKKLDRALALSEELNLPIVMYTEGGGGRPGDTDYELSMDITSFSAWAGQCGRVPTIAVNNGYCYAGNAALFGCADITIATKTSWIGMAGPAMIEGGGMGVYKPTDIGPIEIQSKNGVVDIVAEDEADATRLTKQVLSYFQGTTEHWTCPDQSKLWELMPADRRYTYKVRRIIETLADTDTFIEVRPNFGTGIITGFLRIEGKPFGLICNDCQHLGGAIDAEGSLTGARFLDLCNNFSLPVLCLVDTPGFMVGPESEVEGSVRKMSDLMVAGARLTSPMVAIFLRKGYGLGAIAMTGGSFGRPLFSAAWPSGEFGAMGLEGAVHLGFKKELAAAKSPEEKDLLFNKLLNAMYERGKATTAASYLEIDAVIDPADTRKVIMKAMTAS
jgi:acetyl-CoA carboxylase carboxyltransferase component